jgi:hypothetical protein
MSILDERGKSYGPVTRGGNITRTAALWSSYIGTDITEHDVAWMMVLLKASRSKQDPGNLDNFLDAHGYLDIAERLR